MLVKIILCVIILLSTAETKYNLKQVAQFWKLKQCILPFETLSLNKTEPENHPFLKPCFEKPGNEVCNIFVNFTIQVCKAIGNNTALINRYQPLIGSPIVDQVNNVQPLCSLAKEKNPFILKHASYMANSSYCEAQCNSTMNLCSLLVVALCNYQAREYCQQSSSQGVKEKDDTPQVTKDSPTLTTPVATTTTTQQTTGTGTLTSTLSSTNKMSTSNDTQKNPTVAADTSEALSVTSNKEKTAPKVENDKKTQEPETAQEPKLDKTNNQTKGTEKVKNDKQTEEPKTTQEPKQDKTNTQTKGTETHTGSKHDPNTDGEPEEEPLNDLNTDHSNDLGVTGKKPKGQADDHSSKTKDSSKLNQGAINVEATEGNEADNELEGSNEGNGAKETDDALEGSNKGNGAKEADNELEGSNEGNRAKETDNALEGSNKGNGAKETDNELEGSKDGAQNTDYKKGDKKTQQQSGLSVDDEDESYSSGHFIAYFLSAVIICVAGYIIFHNKQKIMAFVIEGRSAHQRRQRSKGVKYTELKSNVEEVMPSLEKTATAKNFVY
uniref:Uncharacterized protein n=1 Tax=Biomphalaria glabrata TaxID=6526 RepID=A0A2C9KGN3_BIOGL